MEFLNFDIENNNEKTTAKIISEHICDEIDEYTFIFKADKKMTPKQVKLTFEVPYINAFTVWNPGFKSAKTLSPDWNPVNNASRSVMDSPVQTLVSKNNENCLTVAVSDLETPINIKFGIKEKDAKVKCMIEFFTMLVSKRDYYTAVIRIDTRKILYYDSITDVREWWSSLKKYDNADVPETARMPVYSVWYSFHQEIIPDKVLAQCRIAKQLGCESVIIDDGWQTNDSNGGYAYCGDWEVWQGKIADMRKFVEDVHKIGMKFILWYSVPFVGRYSKAWRKFRDKLLNYDEDKEWCCLDPRFKEVRDYLTGIYVKAAKEWKLDGFKLDFIDSFILSKQSSSSPDDGRDYDSLEEAIEALLSEIMTKLREVNPDICIEFRQGYTGPLMQTYGNMLRVGDCPIAAMNNRVGILNLRMLAGKTAVHSDMLMWNEKDSVESAALQFINVLYGVPQISVLLDKIPRDHFDMVKFYLDFWCRNRDILLDGKLKPFNPDANYSIVSAENDKKSIVTAYSNPMFETDNSKKEIVFINGTGAGHLYIKGISGVYRYKVYDCMGNIITETKTRFDGNVAMFDIPLSGMIVIEKQ